MSDKPDVVWGDHHGYWTRAALDEQLAAARAEGYQAGVRDAEGMAEVHHLLCQARLDGVESWRTGRYTAHEVETACTKTAEDILHDIRTLKEGEK